MPPGHSHRLCNLGDAHLQLFGHLSWCWLALIALLELAELFADFIERTDAIEREPHYPRLLSKCLQDALPNPPDCVGNELEPPRFIETFGGFDKPKVPFVDQIAKRQTLVLVLLGHRDDKAKVRFYKLFERCFALRTALPNFTCKLNFLLRREQLNFANLLEVFVQRLALAIGILFRNAHASHHQW